MEEKIAEMTKDQILDTIRQGRREFDKILAPLTEAQMIEPGAQDDWSVKDILAHISAWERRATRWVGEALRGEVTQVPVTTEAEVDAWNARVFQENKDRELADVLAESQQSYEEIVAATEAAPEEALVDPQRYAWLEGEPLGIIVAANTWWHYAEHAESIRAWLGAS